MHSANLIGANFEGANLFKVKANVANLNMANLRGANLKEANLVGATLVRADLEEADLEGADLEGANLEGSNLTKARITNVNLKMANLDGADLTEAVTGGQQRSRPCGGSRKWGFSRHHYRNQAGGPASDRVPFALESEYRGLFGRRPGQHLHRLRPGPSCPYGRHRGRRGFHEDTRMGKGPFYHLSFHPIRPGLDRQAGGASCCSSGTGSRTKESSPAGAPA